MHLEPPPQHDTPKHFFQLLEIGTLEINKIKPNATFIMGATRIGKSCLFNHIRHKRMIGQTDGDTVIYQPYPAQGQTYQDYAPMSAQMNSLTISPNIAELDEETSLVDLAGFLQNRDENEIMAVSYFLLSCFLKLKKVKFILGFNYEQLNPPYTLLFAMLDSFLTLFNIHHLTPQLRHQFVNSVSMVIIKTNKTQRQILNRLQNIQKKLEQKQQLKSKANKLFFIEILNSIRERNRVQIFSEAENQAVIQSSEITNNLNNQGWSFFNLQSAQAQLSQSQAEFLVVPFQKDYKDLQKQQKERLDKLIQTQVSSLIHLNDIFKVTLKQVKQNFLEQKNYNAVFEHIQTYLNQHYPYHSINPHFEVDNQDSVKPLKINIITQSLRLYYLNEKLEQACIQIPQPFQKRIDNCKLIYLSMVQCLKPICNSQQHHYLLRKLNYRFKQEFQQFKKIYKLTPHIISDIGHKMMSENSISINSETPKFNFYKFVINKLQNHNLATQFPDEQSLNKLSTILQQYKKCFQEVKKSKDSIYKSLESYEDFNFNISRVDKDLSLAKISILSTSKNNNTLNEYCNLIQLHLNQRTLIQQLKITDEEKQQLLVENYHQTVGVISQFAMLLLELHSTTNQHFRGFALELSKLAHNVHLCEIIYELQIKQPNQSDECLLKTLNDYVEWCKKWGYLQQAKKNLFHKIYIHQKRKQFDQLKAVQAELKTLHDTGPDLMHSYRSLLDKIFLPFDPQQITALQSITRNITQLLQAQQTIPTS